MAKAINRRSQKVILQTSIRSATWIPNCNDKIFMMKISEIYNWKKKASARQLIDKSKSESSQQILLCQKLPNKIREIWKLCTEPERTPLRH